MIDGAPSQTQQSLAKKRLAVFLVITFALTWGLVIIAGLMLGAFEVGEAGAPLIVAPVAISMFFPLVGALIANRVCGPEGSIDLCFRPRIEGNMRFYLAAWFLPAIVTLLGSIVFFIANPHLFDPTLTGYLDSVKSSMEASGGEAIGNMPSEEELTAMGPILFLAPFTAAITVAPFINMIPAFGEEVGWRGMLFPTLCELMSTRAAVVLSGIIWGLWHAPVIAMGHNYGMGASGFPWTNILVMTIACTAMGACLCYLRLNTQSIWPCALAHGAFNAIANIAVVFCSAGQTLAGPSPLGYVAGIPLFVLGIVCLMKMPNLAQR